MTDRVTAAEERELTSLIDSLPVPTEAELRALLATLEEGEAE